MPAAATTSDTRPGGSRRERERDLRSWLAALGGDAKTWQRSSARGEHDLSRARRLRHCLQAMGPVFSGFGRYLSARRDLLPEAVCEELELIPDLAPPSDYGDVRAVFLEELGCAPERAFSGFEPEPFESRLRWQAHNARLGNAAVTVRVMHTPAAPRLEDALMLHLLAGALAGWIKRPAWFAEAVADYHSELREGWTFASELRAARLLARDAEASGLLGAPRFHWHLCTPHIAVMERAGDLTGERQAPELVRALCLVWLQQALRGSVWPAYPQLANAGLDADGRIVFHSGPMRTLPESARAQIENYLLAVAAQDADESALQLSALYGSRLTSNESEEIRRRIRQMVPFREALEAGVESGRPSRERRFTDEVLIHWRLAGQIRPFEESAVLAFFRGFHQLAQIGRRFAPGHDSLAEAVRDLRLLSLLGEFRNVMRPSEMIALAETYAAAFVKMPEQVNSLLCGTSRGSTTCHCGQERQGRSDSLAVQVSVMLAFGSVMLLLHRIEAAGARFVPDGVTPFILLAAGLSVLYICRRPL